MNHPTAVAELHHHQQHDHIDTASQGSSQGRLNAAISNFLAEASAAGYVVEEVRLCRPALDIDILPRIVIAQHTAAAPALPPIYPPAKLLRLTTPATPQSPTLHPPNLGSLAFNQSPGVMLPPRLSDRASVAGYPLCTTLTPGASSNSEALHGRTGFKRTLSGSIIVKSQTSSPLVKHGDAISPGRCRPIIKLHHFTSPEKRPQDSPTPSKNCQPDLETHDNRHLVRLWSSTATDSARAEAENGPLQENESAPAAVETEFVKRNPKPIQTTYSFESGSGHGGVLQRRDLPVEDPREERNGEGEVNQGTLRDTNDDRDKIPESHVRLFLSSMATLSGMEGEDNETDLKQAGSLENEIGSGDVEDRDEDEKTDDMQCTERVTENETGSASDKKEAVLVRAKKRFASSRGHPGSSERQAGRPSATARPFKCHKCPSSFDRGGHLRVHNLAVHEKKKPFVCQVCNAAFGHSSSLLRHARTVHQASPAIGSGRIGNYLRSSQRKGDGGDKNSDSAGDDYHIMGDDERPFRCSVCRKTFSRVALLNRHVAVKHPVKSPSSQDKQEENVRESESD